MSDEDARVFVSYARVDNEVVRTLAESLREDNVDVVDYLDDVVAPGASWVEYVEGNLAGSTSFIVVVTERYLDSEHCQTELDLIMRRDAASVIVFTPAPITFPARLNDLARATNVREVVNLVRRTDGSAREG